MTKVRIIQVLTDKTGYYKNNTSVGNHVCGRNSCTCKSDLVAVKVRKTSDTKNLYLMLLCNRHCHEEKEFYANTELLKV